MNNRIPKLAGKVGIRDASIILYEAENMQVGFIEYDLCFVNHTVNLNNY